MELKSKAFSGARWMTFGTVIRFILQVAQVLFLTRWLDQSEIGTYSILFVVLGISKIFSDMGISQALIHFQSLTKLQLNTLYWINIFVGFGVFIFLFGLSYPVSWFYNIPELVSLIQIGATMFIILPIGQQFHFLLQKELAFRRIAMAEIFIEITSISALIFFLMYGAGLFAVPFAMITYSIFYTIIFFASGRNIYQPSFHDIDLKSCREPVRYGLFLLGERSINYFLSNLDKIIFGRFFGMEFLGAYELAHQLFIRPLGLLSTIAGKITFPLYSRIQDDYKRLNSWYLKNIQVFTFIAFPIYFGLLALTDETVELLFGEGWGSVVPIFHIIGWRGIFISVGNPLGAYLQSLGRTDLGFYMNIYQIFVYGGFLMIGVWFFDWETTLWIYLFGTTLFMMPIDYYIRNYLTGMRIRLHLLIWVKNFLSGAVMYIVVLLVNSIFLDCSLPFLIEFSLSILTGIITYFVLTYWFNRKPLDLIFETLKI